MRKLSEAQFSLTQSVLVYGPPKVGKTKLAGELAEHDEIAGVIWVDVENGASTLLQLSPKAQSKIQLIQLPDTKSNPVGIQTALKMIRGHKVSICHEHSVVDCAICKRNKAEFSDVELNALPSNWVVVFDSLTQLTDSAIAFITKDKAEDYKMQYDDWGDLGKLMGVFLSHVQNAKFNVVCISHEIEAEREDGSMRIVPVAGTRNFSRNTAKYFGHVVYAEVKGKKHSFTSATTTISNVVAGSRTNVRTEDMKDAASLIEIFRAAAKGAKIPTTTPQQDVATNRVEEAKVELAQAQEELKSLPSPGQDAKPEGTPPTPEELAKMPLMQRIQEKKKWGL